MTTYDNCVAIRLRFTSVDTWRARCFGHACSFLIEDKELRVVLRKAKAHIKVCEYPLHYEPTPGMGNDTWLLSWR